MEHKSLFKVVNKNREKIFPDNSLCNALMYKHLASKPCDLQEEVAPTSCAAFNKI